ncbi:MAG: glucosamine--fructose-6-phosphate aminotransferase (isomerizing) [Halopseudomonas sp.]|jgi:glucosamine--fructose-6-phosphate aminotransferase (isomerizing)|uniref:glutamine--fructose-6-phosphate transaminase (isomerizing) n=1 Tax=Halopseudomonas sp. TaxID=2901191 RepID=UPI0039E6D111
MCGIVGAIAQRNITPILMEGLRRLEYRGYDSAGVAVLTDDKHNKPKGILRVRAVGKVIELENALTATPAAGHLGIAHTRWATHGKPAERNAHPHISGRLAVVHNGIIENHSPLRKRLIALGYEFVSETDTEVVAHLIAHYYSESNDLLNAFRTTLNELHGAYALALIHEDEPDTLYCARMGSPLVIGEGSDEHYIASDPLALLQVTDRFRYLEEGDLARLKNNSCEIWGRDNSTVDRPVKRYEHAAFSMDKGEYRHYMLKEIFEQPQAISDTLAGTLADDHVLTAILGPDAETRLPDIKNIHIVACGTSYHAGLVARYWIEDQAGLPCTVEVASEYRYRTVVVPANTLLITISQSGETADTLAALRFAKDQGYLATLAICNVAGSSLVREADWRLLTHAGPEIGVASTKAFTTQLVALLWLTTALAQVGGKSPEKIAANVKALKKLPAIIEQALTLEPRITTLAERFASKHHALFLGRGTHYPIAMEGALKLKEISYIHAEAYAAGELKHGPLALVDEDMPVVSVAPSDSLLEKLKSNLEEVRARGGQLITFACETVEESDQSNHEIISLPWVEDTISPILYTIPLQLLSYHVALVKGTDVDKPRNLAKSVTVE